jgi:hypothetical protein
VLKELVLELGAKYGSQRKVAKILNICQSFLSLWSRGKQCSIRAEVLQRILTALAKNSVLIERIESLSEYRRRSIAKANAKEKPPSVQLDSVLMENTEGIFVDVMKWLDETGYVKRLRRKRGVVQLLEDVSVSSDELILKYRVFNKTRLTFATHVSVLPRFLSLDAKTLYFLGLWSGDNTGGGRVGIVNKNLDLLAKNVGLLKNCFGQPQHSLIGNVMSISELREADKRKFQDLLHKIGVERMRYTVNRKSYGDLVFSVYVHNAVLKKLLNFLKENLSEIFLKVDAECRGAFYAGLFDAEGNVNNNENKREFNFRWATMDKKFVNFLILWLQEDGFSPRYDGANVKVGYRKETRRAEFQRFRELVLPYIAHPHKQRAAEEMLDQYLQT